MFVLKGISGTAARLLSTKTVKFKENKLLSNYNIYNKCIVSRKFLIADFVV